MEETYLKMYDEFYKKYKELETEKFEVREKNSNKYLLELIEDDADIFNNSIRKMFNIARIKSDFILYEKLLDILIYEKRTNQVIDIFHEQLLENWHCFYDRIIAELQINKNPASVNYLYKALHMKCEFMIESPTVRGNCVYAIWSFETEEAVRIKKLLFEDFLYDVRYAAMQIKENAEGVPVELKEFTDLCEIKNIKYFYGIEPRKDFKIFEFYNLDKNKLFYDGLKEPKILVKDMSEYNWLEKFLRGKNIYISIVHIKKYVRIENGEDIIKILRTYDFNTIFITDDDVTFYITIKKGKEILLQGNAVNWYP